MKVSANKIVADSQPMRRAVTPNAANGSGIWNISKCERRAARERRGVEA